MEDRGLRPSGLLMLLALPARDMYFLLYLAANQLTGSTNPSASSAYVGHYHITLVTYGLRYTVTSQRAGSITRVDRFFPPLFQMQEDVFML